MLSAAWRMSKGYRLCPWRSPYLRWRIETFEGLHADEIDFAGFWKFVIARRRELLRFLHWADAMSWRARS